MPKAEVEIENQHSGVARRARLESGKWLEGFERGGEPRFVECLQPQPRRQTSDDTLRPSLLGQENHVEDASFEKRRSSI